MGGGGKGKVEIITYTYRIYTAYAICYGPIDNFYRLDYNSDFQIYSYVNNNPVTNYVTFATGENILAGCLHFGNTASDQLDPLLQILHGSSTPHYPGICYAAFYLDLGSSPAMPATAFTVGRWPDVFDDYKSNAYDTTSLSSGGSGGFNPANLIYDLLTNNDYGFGLDSSLIDISAFKSVRNTLASEGIWYSTAIQSGDLYAVIRACLDWADGELIYNENTGKIMLKLRRYDYTPATLTEVTASDMRAGTFELVRTSWESTKNVIYVSYFDVTRECDQNVAYAEDLGNYLMLNSLRVQEFNFDCFTNATVAQRVANRLLQKHAYPTAKVSFECFASKGESIAVFDPILVTHDYYGVSQVFRVIEKRRSGQNLWKFEAIEEIFAGAGYYSQIPSYTTEGYTASNFIGYAQYQHLTSWGYRTLETYYRGLLVLGYSDDQSNVSTLTRFSVSSDVFSQTVKYACIGRLNSALNNSGDAIAYIDPDVYYPDDGTETNYYLIDNEIFYANDAYMSGSYLVLTSADAERGIEGTTKASHSVGAKVYNIECRAIVTTKLLADQTYDLTITPWYSSPLTYYDDDHTKTTTITYHNYIGKPTPPSNLTHSGFYSGDITFTWQRDNRIATSTANGAPAFPSPCEGLTAYPTTKSGTGYVDQIIGWRLDFKGLSGTTVLHSVSIDPSPCSYISTHASRMAVAGLCTTFTMDLYARGITGFDSGPISNSIYS